MNELLLIAGSACGALVFIEVACIPNKIKIMIWGNDAHKHRLKPLDCGACLSFWICLITAFILGKNTLEVLFMSVISSILAVLISKMLNK